MEKGLEIHLLHVWSNFLLRSLQLHIHSRSTSLSGTRVSVLCSEELPPNDEMNVVHTVTSYFCKISFDIILFIRTNQILCTRSPWHLKFWKCVL
jgi:hypothetical protein